MHIHGLCAQNHSTGSTLDHWPFRGIICGMRFMLWEAWKCLTGAALRAQNHDTGSTLNHWPFPWNHLHEGYAYILTHPGTPTIFCDHFFADGLGDSIRELLKIRKRAGLHCRSKARRHLRPSAPAQGRSRALLL